MSRQKWSHTKLVRQTDFVHQNRSAGPLLSVKSGPGRTNFACQKWSYPHKGSPTRTTFAMQKLSYPDHFCDAKTVLFQSIMINAISSSDMKTHNRKILSMHLWLHVKQDITLKELFFYNTLSTFYVCNGYRLGLNTGTQMHICSL